MKTVLAIFAVTLVMAAIGPISAQAATPTLRASVGVGDAFTISLRNADGTRVRRLKAGTYRIRVNDASRIHNFRLRGPGVFRTTGISEVTTRTWIVTLKPGVHVFACTPHALGMSSTFRVVT